MKKMLVVYYSWSNGNTERIARDLQAATTWKHHRVKSTVGYGL